MSFEPLKTLQSRGLASILTHSPTSPPYHAPNVPVKFEYSNEYEGSTSKTEKKGRNAARPVSTRDKDFAPDS